MTATAHDDNQHILVSEVDPTRPSFALPAELVRQIIGNAVDCEGREQHHLSHAGFLGCERSTWPGLERIFDARTLLFPPEKQTLLSLSMVGRAWRRPAQELLRRHVVLHTPKQAEDFIASLADNSLVVGELKSLWMIGDVTRAWQQKVLAACGENLDTLVVEPESNRALPSFPKCSNVDHLTLRGTLLTPPLPLESSLPSGLITLDLTGTDLALRLFETLLSRSSETLRHLNITRTRISSWNDPPRVANQLPAFEAAAGRLTSLIGDFDAEAFDQIPLRTLIGWCQRLEYLCLLYLPAQGFIDALGACCHLTHLKEVHLHENRKVNTGQIPPAALGALLDTAVRESRPLRLVNLTGFSGVPASQTVSVAAFAAIGGDVQVSSRQEALVTKRGYMEYYSLSKPQPRTPFSASTSAPIVTGGGNEVEAWGARQVYPWDPWEW